jgi:hypothetical protein
LPLVAQLLLYPSSSAFDEVLLPVLHNLAHSPAWPVRRSVASALPQLMQVLVEEAIAGGKEEHHQDLLQAGGLHVSYTIGFKWAHFPGQSLSKASKANQRVKLEHGMFNMPSKTNSILISC